MHLHRGDRNRRDRVPYRDRCVGVSGGIYQDAIKSALRLPDLLYDLTFMVGLECLQFDLLRLGDLSQLAVYLLECRLAVDVRLALAEQIKVRTMYYQYFLHFCFSASSINITGIPSFTGYFNPHSGFLQIILSPFSSTPDLHLGHARILIRLSSIRPSPLLLWVHCKASRKKDRICPR